MVHSTQIRLSGPFTLKFVPLVFRSVLRNKRRNILTALSFAVSMFLFCALASLAALPMLLLHGPSTSRRLVCHNKAGLAYPLPESYARKIAALNHVTVVQGWQVLPGSYRGPSDQLFSYAVDPESMRELWPEWGISTEGAADFKKLRTAALVGPQLMRNHGWRVGQEITIRGDSPPVDVPVQIVGVLNPAPNSTGPLNMLALRRDYLDSLNGSRGLVTIFWVQVDRLTSIGSVIAAIDTLFSNSQFETQTEAEGPFVQGTLAAFASFFRLAGMLGLLIVVAITLVAPNTAAMSIRERGIETAVMRAIGFSSRLLLFCLVGEGLIIAIAGGLIGCLTTWIVLGRLAPPVPGVNVPMPMAPWTLPLGVVVFAIAGVVSSIVPAAAAARRQIVDGLHWVG